MNKAREKKLGKYYEFPNSRNVGYVLQLLNLNLFALAKYVFGDDMQGEEIAKLLSGTNGELVRKIIEKANAEKQIKKHLYKAVGLRNLICHSYPIGDTYFYFSNEESGEHLVLSSEEFSKKVAAALKEALLMHLFIGKLHEQEENR